MPGIHRHDYHFHGFGHRPGFVHKPGCGPAWHHRRPHCHGFGPGPVRVGPHVHISTHTGRPTPYLHVHRPWYKRCFFWHRPAPVVHVGETAAVLPARRISPIAATVAAVGVAATVSGVALGVVGACLLPVTFGGSLTLMLAGGGFALGGMTTTAVAAAAA